MSIYMKLITVITVSRRKTDCEFRAIKVINAYINVCTYFLVLSLTNKKVTQLSLSLKDNKISSILIF